MLHDARLFSRRVNILDRIQKRHLYPLKPLRLFNGLQDTLWVLPPFPVTSGPIDRDGSKAHDLRTLPHWNSIVSVDRNVRNCPLPKTKSQQSPRGRTQYSKGPRVDIHPLTRLYPFTGSIPAFQVVPDRAVDWPLASLIRVKLAVPAGQRVGDLFHYRIRNPQATFFFAPSSRTLNDRPMISGYCTQIVRKKSCFLFSINIRGKRGYFRGSGWQAIQSNLIARASGCTCRTKQIIVVRV